MKKLRVNSELNIRALLLPLLLVVTLCDTVEAKAEVIAEPFKTHWLNSFHFPGDISKKPFWYQGVSKFIKHNRRFTWVKISGQGLNPIYTPYEITPNPRNHNKPFNKIFGH